MAIEEKRPRQRRVGAELGKGLLLDAGVVRVFLILALTGLGLFLCYRLALPFLPSLTWALVLGILLAPAHRWLHSRLGSGDLAAFIAVAAAAIVILGMLLLVVQQLVREAAGGAISLENAVRTLDWRETIGNRPRLAEAAAWLEQRFDPAGALGGLAHWLTSQSTSLLRGSVSQVIGLILTFYILFYFLRDRERAMRVVAKLSPLQPTETGLVVRRLADTVHATIIGTIVVATVQGTLGGLIFWWLGLPTPVFWGLVMGLLAIVPVLGAFVIWLPAALLLALQGDWTRALILVIWGGVIIATIDNLLYPALVGSRLKLHTMVMFIGAVGGIILFGASGLVLGPATIAVTLALIEILQGRFRAELQVPTEMDMARQTKESPREAESLKREADEELNLELEQTFPASDPLKITRGSYEQQHTRPKDRRKPD